MNTKRIEEILKIADDLATARVQRYVTQVQYPEDDLRHRAVDQRVRMVRAKLREQLAKL